MREILFRGKANCEGRDNEWVYGGLLPETENTFPIIVRDYDNDEDWIGINGWETVAPETVGQYTGLTDKNGKKIFEGDICLCDRNINDHIDNKTFIVEFEPLRGWFGESKDGWSEFDGSAWECAEVIGNIHDNPELLKGGDG